jgi:hypothetical protein
METVPSPRPNVITPVSPELLRLLEQLPSGIHAALISFCRAVLATHRRAQ